MTAITLVFRTAIEYTGSSPVGQLSDAYNNLSKQKIPLTIFSRLKQRHVKK